MGKELAGMTDRRTQEQNSKKPDEIQSTKLQ
ncbi:hypothetical protein T4D_11429 [Trichinella pseudospiralis]|uniref:Uncharacterized protein n=1 Tax=Trichinella pseudospiralis TaxID=6337 RepID=A0A0V1DN70_TRIPS|nr:hypothetical protein T4D_11429 [Trichinella pseudospiralis]